MIWIRNKIVFNKSLNRKKKSNHPNNDDYYEYIYIILYKIIYNKIVLSEVMYDELKL
jgi:hypothetical protein